MITRFIIGFVKIALIMCSVTFAENYNIVVLGLGGRAQQLLLECIKLNLDRKINVIAVCDADPLISQQFFVQYLAKKDKALAQRYKEIFENTSFYADTIEDIQQLFQDYSNADIVIIASANDRHFLHLNATLKAGQKNIFIEKPVFRDLEEFKQFDMNLVDATIHVGLVLRYSMMTKIAEEIFRKNASVLGKLLKVKAWEYVNFSHAFTIIMMNWRRFISNSGGLLVEKSIHDLDLALYFMHAVGFTPQMVNMTSSTSHDFFKKSRQHEILTQLLADITLRKKTEKWENTPFKKVINFAHDSTGTIDWPHTLENFFVDFPESDEDLEHSNIIPDNHILKAVLKNEIGHEVDFELNVKLNNFAIFTERGCYFTFEHGTIFIDIEKGKLRLMINGHEDSEIDLMVDDQSHGGGEPYVAKTIMGCLESGQPHAQLHDSAVQLSSIMALLSEKQAVNAAPQNSVLIKIDNKWRFSSIL